MTWFDDALTIIEKKHGAEKVATLRAKGLPTPKTEGWQHAGLRQFFAVERRLLETETNRPSVIPSSDEDRVVLWNGRYMPDASRLPEGVRVVVAEPSVHPEELVNMFESIALALAPCVQITVARSLDRPLRVESYVEGMLPSFVCQSIALTLEDGVRAEVLLQTEVLGTDPGHLLCSALITEVVAANLTLTDLPCAAVTTLRSEYTSVIARSSYERFLAGNGTGLSLTDLKTVMAHEATARLHGLYLQKEDISAVRSVVVHIGPHSTSSQAFRSSVMDGARTSFDITTEVREHADGTEAVQESRHMLLGEGARAFTVPRLIINTDDVQCRHGATVGHADTEQLAYMKARGIGEQRARSLLAYGHLSSLLAEYPDAVRPRLESTLRSHLLLS